MRIRKRFKIAAITWSRVLLAAPFLVSVAASGQGAGALLNRVEKTGFYRIILPPQVVARCRPDLSDLRLMRPNGDGIPYVLNTDIHSPWNAGFQPLPDPVIRQKDSSDKHSYVRLGYRDAYRVDRLSFVIKGPSLYKRRVRIIVPDTTGDMHEAAVVSIDPYDSAFRIPATKGRQLLIDIDNGDNTPVTVTRVASFQSGIYVLAYLSIGYDYYLTASPRYTGKPDYDLHYFTDSLRQRPMDIGFREVFLSDLVVPAMTKDSVRSDSTVDVLAKDSRTGTRSSAVLLWSALALVLLFLLYFSVKMVKAIGKKESNDRL
jgi:hypothetical protein